MIEIQRQGPDDANDEDDGAVDSENDQRQVGEGLVEDDLGPVKAEIADPVQPLDAVVQLVELPEPRHVVQQPVNVPLDEILEQEERAELQPERCTGKKREGLRERQTLVVQKTIEPRDEPAGNQCQDHAEIVLVEYEPAQIHGAIRSKAKQISDMAVSQK